MNNKFYVSLETAKLLKEKGYNEECTTIYDCLFKEIIPAISVGLYRNECMRNDYYCSAPTKAEAIDWLDSKGIVVIVDISFSDGTWIYSIYREGEHLYDSIISKESCFSTRLESEEAAIIKTCELLENGN